MFIIAIIIFIPITQPQDRLAENQAMASLSSLNEFEYENGMKKSETELQKPILSLVVITVEKGHHDIPFEKMG